MTHHSILDQLLEEATRLHRQGLKLLAVFDIDSTLLNVTGRTQTILKHLASDTELARRFPEEIKILNQVEFTPKDWGLRDPLQRAGLGPTAIDFFMEIRLRWIEHFFSNTYLHEDRPYDGAVEYLKELKGAGAHIMYLTGRDEPRMGEGTRAYLKKWNFPLEEDGCELILKPHQSLDDAQFKKDIFLKLGDKYKAVWLFENEPVNVHLVAAECPHVRIVFFDSTHSGRAEPPTQHPIIEHYLRPAKSTPKKGKA